MIRPGVDLHQLSLRREHASEFGINGEAEHAQYAIQRARLYRQVGIAADNPRHSFVLLRRGKDGPLGDVQADRRQMPCLIVRSKLAQVVAFAATGIETAHRRTGNRLRQHGAPCRVGNPLVMAGIEKAPARRHHLLAVAGIARAFVLHGQQMGVALAGDVESVAVGTAPRSTVAAQRFAVQRAGQRGERRNAHCCAAGHGQRDSVLTSAWRKHVVR